MTLNERRIIPGWKNDPDARSPPGVQFHDILTRFLSGSGGIDNVINDVGGAVSSANPGPNYVVSYP